MANSTTCRFMLLVCYWSILTGGCRSTIPVTKTSESGSQQLLLNSSADSVISSFDFSPLSGRLCYLDTSGLGEESDGYLPYRIREQMSFHGVRLAESSAQADIIVEAGLAAYGTDAEKDEFGIVEADAIPDFSLCIRGTQFGVAKLSMFAWEKESGQAIWHSGTMRADSYLEIHSAIGSLPTYSGTIQHPANRIQRQRPAKPLH